MDSKAKSSNLGAYSQDTSVSQGEDRYANQINEEDQYRSDRRRENEYYHGNRNPNIHRTGGSDYRLQRNYQSDYHGGNKSYRSSGREPHRYEYQERARERTREPTRAPMAYRESSPRGFGESIDRRNPRDQHLYNERSHRENSRSQLQHHANRKVPYTPTFNRKYGEKMTNMPNPKEMELSRDEKISKYKKRLEALSDATKLEDVKVIGSQWGVKPRGFENVTAQRAKLSGLFPLPGFPRPVDFTKLEGVVKDRLMNSNDILNESSKIDPLDSRNSRILIINNIDFEKVNYLKIVEYFNDFLKKVDTEETSNSNIESKRKTKDDKNLIIEFSNSTCATIAMALNGISLSCSDFVEEEHLTNKPQEIFTLKMGRPGEYVSQCLTQDGDSKSENIEEKVIDSPRKLTLIVSSQSTETEIIDMLKSIAPIKAFQLLREIGTKKSLGVAFVEFYMETNTPIAEAIIKLQRFIELLLSKDIVNNAFFSTIIPNSTSIQECEVDLNCLKNLVKNKYVSAHPRSRVIQLINIITAKDLVEDSNYRFIEKDISGELSKYGPIISMKIPRPANDYTPGLMQFSEVGLGKIYVEFEDEETALNAIMGSAGKMYNDRTLLCAFFNFNDYKNGLL